MNLGGGAERKHSDHTTGYFFPVLGGILTDLQLASRCKPLKVGVWGLGVRGVTSLTLQLRGVASPGVGGTAAVMTAFMVSETISRALLSP